MPVLRNSPFLDRFRMNRDAGDLWEFFLHAVFEGTGDIVDLSDGKAAVHGAVAGDQDFALAWRTRRAVNDALPCGEELHCV